MSNHIKRFKILYTTAHQGYYKIINFISECFQGDFIYSVTTNQIYKQQITRLNIIFLFFNLLELKK